MKGRKEFDQKHEECINIVRQIKLKNDSINKKHGVDGTTRELIEEVRKDKDFVVAEV